MRVWDFDPVLFERIPKGEHHGALYICYAGLGVFDPKTQ
jgi:hypothetical protein